MVKRRRGVVRRLQRLPVLDFPELGLPVEVKQLRQRPESWNRGQLWVCVQLVEIRLEDVADAQVVAGFADGFVDDFAEDNTLEDKLEVEFRSFRSHRQDGLDTLELLGLRENRKKRLLEVPRLDEGRSSYLWSVLCSMQQQDTEHLESVQSDWSEEILSSLGISRSKDTGYCNVHTTPILFRHGENLYTWRRQDDRLDSCIFWSCNPWEQCARAIRQWCVHIHNWHRVDIQNRYCKTASYSRHHPHVCAVPCPLKT